MKPVNALEARALFMAVSWEFAHELNPINFMMLNQAAMWLREFAVEGAEEGVEEEEDEMIDEGCLGG